MSASGAIAYPSCLQTDNLPAVAEHNRRLPNGRYPALVLNADFTPLSYVPLSLWSWQDSVRAVYRDVVTVLSYYDIAVRSPSESMALPSVIVLKKYVGRVHDRTPCFTRRNLFLRDSFACQYCCQTLPAHELTYDHVNPRAAGGGTHWQNVVTACSKCNLRKGSHLLSQVPDMDLKAPPHKPTWRELQQKARAFPPKDIHDHWVDFV